MTALDLARLQFATTTIFHFLFVPLSIGLAFYVAVNQTLHYRTGKEVYARQVHFWGRLMLLSFAVGVVTGIIQEFQFGMNWSEYSRFVGDIFGAPLAMEALIAFFMESTFLGFWIFAKGRVSPKTHLVSIWLVSIGSALSAFFIIAANSWMQHPVGYKMVGGKPHLTSIWAVITNNTAIAAYIHVLAAAALTASLVTIGVAGYHLRREHQVDAFTTAIKVALPILCIGVVVSFLAGDQLARLLIKQQPMKMAAAEALFNTEKPASMSLLATGDFTANPGHTNRDLKIPHVLSLLATRSWDGQVLGVNQLQKQYEAKYGPGRYYPYVAVVYWSYRIMVYLFLAMAIFALVGFILWRRGKLAVSRRFQRIAIWMAVTPFLVNTAGWVMTEVGRQPWIVQGLMLTRNANSPLVTTAQVAGTLIGFTLIFTAIGGVALWLFLREARKGIHEEAPAPGGPGAPDLSLAY
ncbi:MAG TPA: cytochrome ubiquinol oxidase subunit I [Solirubrobacteraceae bacterium]|nr:cytochrome ubiquinol oxidase subunit I [Solirubrobacteraceae bacterium]